MKEEFKINMFIEPILNKKKKYHLGSYIQLKRLIRKLNKTSPSFDMMLEMHEFIKLLERLYMYGNDNNHYLFSATIPKGYSAAMIYKEDNFEIKYVLRENDKLIAIECITKSQNTKHSRKVQFHEGDNIIKDKYDEELFLFIISCLMNGLIELMTYYYKNKKL